MKKIKDRFINNSRSLFRRLFYLDCDYNKPELQQSERSLEPNMGVKDFIKPTPLSDEQVAYFQKPQQ